MVRWRCDSCSVQVDTKNKDNAKYCFQGFACGEKGEASEEVLCLSVFDFSWHFQSLPPLPLSGIHPPLSVFCLSLFHFSIAIPTFPSVRLLVYLMGMYMCFVCIAAPEAREPLLQLCKKSWNRAGWVCVFVCVFVLSIYLPVSVFAVDSVFVHEKESLFKTHICIDACNDMTCTCMYRCMQ